MPESELYHRDPNISEFSSLASASPTLPVLDQAFAASPIEDLSELSRTDSASAESVLFSTDMERTTRSMGTPEGQE